MDDFLLSTHSIWRWVILPVALGALMLSLASAAGKRDWDVVSGRFSFFFTLTMDIQLLVGLVLWVTQQRWLGNGALTWLHPVAMFGAVGLAHVGRARADRATNSQAKGRQALIFFVASLLVVILAIPIGSWPL